MKGYAIDVAGDGESADEKAFYERYDLIILDLNLPKLDGFFLCSEIFVRKI